MTPRNRTTTPTGANANIVLFDEASRVGSQAARRSVEKVWLSMCLGSVLSVSFILAVKHVF